MNTHLYRILQFLLHPRVIRHIWMKVMEGRKKVRACMAQCFNALSLRAKFKDKNTVLITVMDSKTDAVYAVVWQFRTAKMHKAKVSAQGELDAVSIASEDVADEEITSKEGE